MLRARIFPIAPGEEKKVVVRFQMVAEREGDALRMDYFRGKTQANLRPGNSRSEPAGRLRGSFTLTYPSDADIRKSLTRPTHSLTTIRTRRVGGSAAYPETRAR